LEGHTYFKEDHLLWKDNDHSLVSSDLTVACHVVTGEQELTLPVQTAYKNFTNRIKYVVHNKIEFNILLRLMFY